MLTYHSFFITFATYPKQTLEERVGGGMSITPNVIDMRWDSLHFLNANLSTKSCRHKYHYLFVVISRQGKERHCPFTEFKLRCKLLSDWSWYDAAISKETGRVITSDWIPIHLSKGERSNLSFDYSCPHLWVFYYSKSMCNKLMLYQYILLQVRNWWL